MALTRKLLEAMGIETDKVDEIITAHRETVDALKAERDKFRETAEKVPEIQKKLDEAEKKIAETGENDKWKVKYDALKEESDKYRASVEAEKTKAKKADAYKELLKETGVSEKRLAAVLKVTDLAGVEFGEDGKLKDVDKLKDSIKSEWADFIETKSTEGANTPTPPNGKGDGAVHTPSRAAQVAAKHYEMMYGKKAEENK